MPLHPSPTIKIDIRSIHIILEVMKTLDDLQMTFKESRRVQCLIYLNDFQLILKTVVFCNLQTTFKEFQRWEKLDVFNVNAKIQNGSTILVLLESRNIFHVA